MFLPSFLFILIGGPAVETTREDTKLTAPLTGITAAVVGVILSLAVFFAWHVLWPEATASQPFAGEFEWPSLWLTAAALIRLWRFRLSVIPVIGASAIAGLGFSFPMYRTAILGSTVLVAASATFAQQQAERGPRQQPGTTMGMYAPEQHDLYDGHFIIRGSRVHQVGTLNDPSPWDHMGNDASNVRPVEGDILIDVNEIENTGTFRAELDLPEGRYVVELDRFHEFSPCQDGGVAAWLFEHGDSGCGDMNWPKSVLFVAGWGYGHATLNGAPLYQDYEIHFMVTQGMRDRETLKVMLEPSSGEAGAVNPAAQQLDFYIRSPERNDANHPNREVFDHFFAMEVTWQ